MAYQVRLKELRIFKLEKRTHAVRIQACKKYVQIGGV